MKRNLRYLGEMSPCFYLGNPRWRQGWYECGWTLGTSMVGRRQAFAGQQTVASQAENGGAEGAEGVEPGKRSINPSIAMCANCTRRTAPRRGKGRSATETNNNGYCRENWAGDSSLVFGCSNPIYPNYAWRSRGGCISVHECGNLTYFSSIWKN